MDEKRIKTVDPEDNTLNGLIEAFDAASFDNVSTPDFSQRYTLRQFREYLRKISPNADAKNE